MLLHCMTNSMIFSLLDNKMMNKNPYVQTLIEMGYDEADCRMVASVGVKKTFPLNIHGRIFNTQEEYDDAVRDYINEL